MDDGKDRDALSMHSVDDSIVSDDQFADGSVLVFRHYPPQPGVTSKAPDIRDNASGQRGCVRHRVLTDVLDDLAQVGSGSYRPAD